MQQTGGTVTTTQKNTYDIFSQSRLKVSKFQKLSKPWTNPTRLEGGQANCMQLTLSHFPDPYNLIFHIVFWNWFLALATCKKKHVEPPPQKQRWVQKKKYTTTFVDTTYVTFRKPKRSYSFSFPPTHALIVVFQYAFISCYKSYTPKCTRKGPNVQGQSASAAEVHVQKGSACASAPEVQSKVHVQVNVQRRKCLCSVTVDCWSRKIEALLATVKLLIQWLPNWWRWWTHAPAHAVFICWCLHMPHAHAVLTCRCFNHQKHMQFAHADSLQFGVHVGDHCLLLRETHKSTTALTRVATCWGVAAMALDWAL